MSKGKRWSPSEVELLRKVWSITAPAKLPELFPGRSMNAIKNQALGKLNLPPHPRGVFSSIPYTTMEIGESFSHPHNGRARSSVSQANRLHAPKKFSTRRVSKDETLIWRIR